MKDLWFPGYQLTLQEATFLTLRFVEGGLILTGYPSPTAASLLLLFLSLSFRGASSETQRRSGNLSSYGERDRRSLHTPVTAFVT